MYVPKPVPRCVRRRADGRDGLVERGAVAQQPQRGAMRRHPRCIDAVECVRNLGGHRCFRQGRRSLTSLGNGSNACSPPALPALPTTARLAGRCGTFPFDADGRVTGDEPGSGGERRAPHVQPRRGTPSRCRVGPGPDVARPGDRHLRQRLGRRDANASARSWCDATIGSGSSGTT